MGGAASRALAGRFPRPARAGRHLAEPDPDPDPRLRRASSCGIAGRHRNHPELQAYYRVTALAAAHDRRRSTSGSRHCSCSGCTRRTSRPACSTRWTTNSFSRATRARSRRTCSRSPASSGPGSPRWTRSGPAGGFDLRLGSRARGLRRLSRRPRGRAALRRGRLGGDHRRRPGRDGGCQSRREGRRRPLGRVQHRAAARAGLERVRRHRLHVQALLRAQGLLREARGGLRHLPGRVRHARRAVRGADARSRRARRRTSPSSSSTATTGAGCSTGSAARCSPTG